MKKMPLKKLKVKSIMAENGLTQRDLSKRTGINECTISRAINGSKCHAKTLQAISKALNISVEEIIDG